MWDPFHDSSDSNAANRYLMGAHDTPPERHEALVPESRGYMGRSRDYDVKVARGLSRLSAQED